MYNHFYRRMTDEEKQDENFRMYKFFAAFREEAGGPLDPLFFGSDSKGLGNVPEQEVGICVCKPIPGAMGFQVSGLGEWRTNKGTAVQIVEIR